MVAEPQVLDDLDIGNNPEEYDEEVITDVNTGDKEEPVGEEEEPVADEEDSSDEEEVVDEPQE